jgi:hypothetical protein
LIAVMVRAVVRRQGVPRVAQQRLVSLLRRGNRHANQRAVRSDEDHLADAMGAGAETPGVGEAFADIAV